MRTFLQAIEKRVPMSLRHLGTRFYELLPTSMRYGSIYRETVGFLQKSQYWNKEQHDEYQLKTLKLLVQHATNHVPFYRDLYKKHRITTNDIQSLSDLLLLPTVQKNDLQHHLQDMKAENYPPSKFQYHTTGGSTGQPVGLFWESDRTVPLEKAFMYRQWKWVDFDMEKDKAVILRGVPTASGQHIENVSSKTMRLSSYYLTPDIIKHYIKAIQDFRPKAIQAYPSAAYIVAQYILNEGGIKFPSLKVVLCGSENMYPWQRNIIERAFGCRVYSWYGLSEYVALAGECEHSYNYHCYAEYGIVEVVNSEGFPAEFGNSGEIVATGFNNFAFPLIRYRTQDLATLSLNQQCACGRNYLLIEKIDGRLQEMIVAKNGNLISMTAINMHSNVFDNLYQFQFYQDTVGKLVMRQLRKPTFTNEDVNKIDYELKLKLGNQFELSYCAVDNIETTIRGKARFLIQQLEINNFTKNQL